MANDRITVDCPHCRAKLLLSPARARVTCPKCGGSAAVAGGNAYPVAGEASGAPESVSTLKPGAAASPASAPTLKVGPGDGTAGDEAPRATLGAYLAECWKRERGGFFLKVTLAVVSAAVLSLSKPTIGHRGMLYALAGLICLTAGAHLLYNATRVAAYVLKRKPQGGTKSTSVLAWSASCGTVCALAAWGPLVAAETFSPVRGWLATLAPRLAAEQDRWLVEPGSRSAYSTARDDGGRRPPRPPALPPRALGRAADGGGNGTRLRPDVSEAHERERLRLEREGEARKRQELIEKEQTDDPVVERLIANLKDKNPSTCAQAGWALAKMSDNLQAQAAFHAVYRVVVEDVDAEAKNYANEHRNKDAALEALKALAPEKVTAALLEAGRSQSVAVKMWAVDKLMELRRRERGKER
jgi:hypothetical protein